MANEKDLLEERLRDPAARLGFEQEWLSEEFVTQFEQQMEQRGISRRDLAKRLGKSPPYVTQALRRGSNLTIRTMVELAMALEMRVGLMLVPLAEVAMPRSLRWHTRAPSIEWVSTTEHQWGIEEEQTVPFLDPSCFTASLGGDRQGRRVFLSLDVLGDPLLLSNACLCLSHVLPSTGTWFSVEDGPPEQGSCDQWTGWNN